MISRSLFAEAFSKKDPKYQETESFWDHRAEQFNQKDDPKEFQSNFQVLYQWLKSQNGIPTKGSVLDVGCGPGRHAIAFSERGHSVVGLDISEKMLEFAYKNSWEHGLQDRFIGKKAIWEEINPDKEGFTRHFDLVFASNSPAICNEASLRKMSECSRGACFMSHFVNKQDDLRDYLVNELHLTNHKPIYDQSVYYSFNLLWHDGFYPSITYVDRSWEIPFSLEEAIDYYTLYFQMHPNYEESKDKQLKDILIDLSYSGPIIQKVTSKVAWVYWKVK